MIFAILGIEVGSKNPSKILLKRSQDEKASRDKFLMDFGGFGEASWEGKSSQEASKIASNGLHNSMKN